MTVVNHEPQHSQESERTTGVGADFDVQTALPDLQGSFKEVVTRSLDEILRDRPAEPIRVLADRLLEASESHAIERIQCVVGDGVECTLTRACTRRGGAGLHEVPGLPLLRLVTPTVFELDVALRHLDALTPPNQQVILFLEPPSPPVDLFFLKGVPYVTDITEQLLKQRRRRAAGDAAPDSEPSDFAEPIPSLLQNALGLTVSTLREEVTVVAAPSSRFRVVELPEIQRGFFELFDIIDGAFGGKKHYWDAHTIPQSALPSVVLVSFNSRTSKMTLSRIIAAMLPLHEQLQRHKIASILENNKERIRRLNYSYVSDYWKEVLQRREERDRARGEVRTTQARFKARQQKPPHGKKKKMDEKKEKNVDLALAARIRRREDEDNLFLQVLQRLRAQAVTRIQALYRGYRWRKKAKMPRPQGKGDVDVACLVEELPFLLPALLRRCVERLGAIHGELFGNYAASCPPVPRSVTVLKPLRTVLKAEDEDTDDIDSESELWEMETVILPLKRQTKLLPHFNAIRRLMECEVLSNCNTIEEAMSLQNDCIGLSLLQRRAYDGYKSSVLNLLHIAFLELYHREKLPATVVTFGEYMQCFHMDVFAWLSAPHIFSRIDLQVSLKNENPLPVLCDREVMETERVLLAQVYKEGSLYVSPYLKRENEDALQKQTLQEDEEQLVKNEGSLLVDLVRNIPSFSLWRCEGVYAAPAFLSEASWGTALQEISSQRSGGKVVWWSLHPNPAVYVNGEPLVLTTRHELQEVEGRPSFDEYVPRIEKRTKTTAQHVSNNASGTTPSVDVYHPSVSSTKSSLGLKKSDKLTSSDGSAKTDTNLSNGDILADEMHFSTFGVSLRGEDIYLARMLNQSTATDETLCFQFYSTPKKLNLYGVPVTHATREPLVMLSDSESYALLKQTPRDIVSVMCASLLESPLPRPNSLYSQHLEPWSRTMDSAKKVSVSFENCPVPHAVAARAPVPGVSVTSTEGASREVLDTGAPLLFSGAESVDAVAHRVAQCALRGGEFVHLRPWMIQVCSRAWLSIFERFMSRCLSQIREGYSIVLAVSDPSHVMLFNAVCLLKHAMHKQTTKNESEDSIPVFRTGPRRSQLTSPLPLLSVEAVSSLSFMDGFYDCVKKLVRRGKMFVTSCVHTVQNLMRENSPGGLIFLEELPTLIRSAESETNPRLLVDTILTIVQRVELYCWLILFQVFLSLPVATSLLDEGSKVEISSFSAFVGDAALTTWMDRIDPWSNTPWRSPDPFHLRYSNGLRRWDDRNYIFRVAS